MKKKSGSRNMVKISYNSTIGEPKAMIHGKCIFSQSIDMINREKFNKNTRRRLADKGSKGFSTWDLLVSMLYLQLAQAKSLRGIEYGLKGCVGKLRHLGMSDAPKRSTLSYANAHRPWQLFRDTFYQMLERCHSANMPRKRKFRFKNKLFSLDATSVATSPNAVLIQVWTALTAMLMLAYMRFKSTFGWSLSNLVAMFRWNVFAHKELWSWLDNPFESPPPEPENCQPNLPGFNFGQQAV